MRHNFKVAVLATVCSLTVGCDIRRTTPDDGQSASMAPPKIATQQSAGGEAMRDGIEKGISSMIPSMGSNSSDRADHTSGLAVDRPFPDNGTSQVSFEISADQEVSEVTAYNQSADNIILLWFYNFGKGDREAARLYLRAGQSGRMVLPTYEYRLAAYTAPANLGLDRGFGDDAKLRDFGFVDMRTPSSALRERASFTYSGYGMGKFRPGTAAQ